ncbi:hypothetical protein DPEC_G00341670 [Dallia pectoralis]|uniref:Uncharacterized protein n=1 Tax=Dallia pectoralis TaxID=75939 RepID=A0ACC2F5I9_DALPE|nr:hypothetical protein DPEC_G00341670 [Dallia pectoralis]
MSEKVDVPLQCHATLSTHLGPWRAHLPLQRCHGTSTTTTGPKLRSQIYAQPPIGDVLLEWITAGVNQTGDGPCVLLMAEVLGLHPQLDSLPVDSSSSS